MSRNIIKDIKTPNGDAIIDEVNDAIRVNVVASTGGGLTDAELRATPVPVSATLSEPISVDDNGGSLTVDGTVTANAGSGPWPVTDNSGSLTVDIPDVTTLAKAVTASASGDTTIHTPTASNRTKLGYICLSADGANSADVTVIVKFTAGGSTLYKISLKAGAIWARNIGAGQRYLDGGVNNALIVNLSTAQTVNVSIEYTEST